MFGMPIVDRTVWNPSNESHEIFHMKPGDEVIYIHPDGCYITVLEGANKQLAYIKYVEPCPAWLVYKYSDERVDKLRADGLLVEDFREDKTVQ